MFPIVLHKVPSAKAYLVEEAKAVWRSLSMPVLSLYGSESPWMPADLAERITCLPRVRSWVVEGAGHNIHHDRPTILADTIDRFVRDPEQTFSPGLTSGLPSP